MRPLCISASLLANECEPVVNLSFGHDPVAEFAEQRRDFGGVFPLSEKHHCGAGVSLVHDGHHP